MLAHIVYTISVFLRYFTVTVKNATNSSASVVLIRVDTLYHAEQLSRRPTTYNKRETANENMVHKAQCTSTVYDTQYDTFFKEFWCQENN
jgi:hypothetical protein